MKIRIAEEAPGELLEKATHIVSVVEQLTGQELLKAEAHSMAYQFEHPVLKGVSDKQRKVVSRIREVANQKIAEILSGNANS